jgi:choice-of-anchor C domain-containing protein
MRNLLLGILLLPCALAAPARAANLVANGGFEVVPNPGAATVMLASGSTTISPWVVTAGNVEDVGNLYWEPASGGCSLALNGTTAGTVAQSFATLSGATYTVSFSLAGDAFSVPEIKHVRVKAAGSSMDFSFDTAASWQWAMGWQRVSWPFTATASTTTLEFQSLEAGLDTGPAIDSVEVVLTGPLDAGPFTSVLALAAVAPNPASGPAHIAWSLPRAAHVRLAGYDVRGRQAFVVADGNYEAGPHGASWDARGVRPGVYVLKLSADGETRTQRVAVVR